jgi:hypothetical protein
MAALSYPGDVGEAIIGLLGPESLVVGLVWDSLAPLDNTVFLAHAHRRRSLKDFGPFSNPLDGMAGGRVAVEWAVKDVARVTLCGESLNIYDCLDGAVKLGVKWVVEVLNVDPSMIRVGRVFGVQGSTPSARSLHRPKIDAVLSLYAQNWVALD